MESISEQMWTKKSRFFLTQRDQDTNKNNGQTPLVKTRYKIPSIQRQPHHQGRNNKKPTYAEIVRLPGKSTPGYRRQQTFRPRRQHPANRPTNTSTRYPPRRQLGFRPQNSPMERNRPGQHQKTNRGGNKRHAPNQQRRNDKQNVLSQTRKYRNLHQTTHPNRQNQRRIPRS